MLTGIKHKLVILMKEKEEGRREGGVGRKQRR